MNDPIDVEVDESDGSDEVTITLRTTEDMVLEIGCGILGRGQDIHDNPDYEFEPTAEELAGVGMELIQWAEDWDDGPRDGVCEGEDE